eukprot:jgi/Botrbrau1/9238/Bobra.0028s0033.1
MSPATLLKASPLASLPTTRHHAARRQRTLVVRTMAKSSKKALTYDAGWSKGYFTNGYFLEGPDKGGSTYLKTIEKKKLLSGVESLGLLSKAEQAGLTLSTVEKLGLLSTAEKLGLLETAENLLVTDPGKVTALSIPALLASLAFLILVPDDNVGLALVKYGGGRPVWGSGLDLLRRRLCHCRPAGRVGRPAGRVGRRICLDQL